MKQIIPFLVLIIPMAVFGKNGSDSIPATDSVAIARSAFSIGLKEDKAVGKDKYIFKPIFSNKFDTKNKNRNLGVMQSFHNQPAGALSYNVTLEGQDFINSYRRRNESGLLSMKKWGAYYLSSMERILVQNGIPRQLVYLAVIETDLDINSVSWCGAAGMWQFMPETGRNYGLYVRNGIDERFDWNKSTYAAAGYLRDLYAQLKDWLLVVAAYNGGPGRVRSAINRSGSRNFWDLQYYLPTESSNHVKKFIATQYIMDGSTGIAGLGNISEAPKKFFNPLAKGVVAIDTTKNKVVELAITGRYNSLVLSKYITLDIVSFNLLNPNFDAEIAKNTSNYTLRLPEDKMQLFKYNQLQIMNESLQLFLSIQGVGVTAVPNSPKKKSTQ